MLCHFLRNNSRGFCLLSVLCCYLQCHTVAFETNQSNFDESLILSTLGDNISRREIGKTENEEKTNQTQNLNVLDDKSHLLTTTSNQTLLQVKPAVASGQFNASQSLPAWMTTIKSGALERTGFVALGFMLIVIAFFIVRAVRLRHKRSKSRKYGIITSTDMEMEPLDRDDEEEEDTTLFDAQQKYTLP